MFSAPCSAPPPRRPLSPSLRSQRVDFLVSPPPFTHSSWSRGTLSTDLCSRRGRVASLPRCVALRCKRLYLLCQLISAGCDSGCGSAFKSSQCGSYLSWVSPHGRSGLGWACPAAGFLRGPCTSSVGFIPGYQGQVYGPLSQDPPLCSPDNFSFLGPSLGSSGQNVGVSRVHSLCASGCCIDIWGHVG